MPEQGQQNLSDSQGNEDALTADQQAMINNMVEGQAAEQATPAPAAQSAPAQEQQPTPPPADFNLKDLKPEDMVKITEKPEFWPQDMDWSKVPEDIRPRLQNIHKEYQSQRDRAFERQRREMQQELEENKQATVEAMKSILAQQRQGVPPMGQQFVPQGYEQQDPAIQLQQVLQQMATRQAQLEQTVSEQNQRLDNVGRGAYELANQAAMERARASIGPVFDQYSEAVSQLCASSKHVVSPEQAFFAVAGPDLARYSYRKGMEVAGRGKTPTTAPPFSAPAQAGRGGESVPGATSPEVVDRVRQEYAKSGDDRLLYDYIDAYVDEGRKQQAEINRGR